MIIGKDKILEHFEFQQKKYFAIFYRGKVGTGNAIHKNAKVETEDALDKEAKAELKKEFDKAYSFEQGKDNFERYLAIIGPGEYTLIISDNLNVTTRGNSTVDFKVPVSESNNAPQRQSEAVGAIPTGYVTKEEALQIGSDAFDKKMMARQLEEANKKIAEQAKDLKELEKSAGDPINKLVGALSPHAPAIIAGLFPQAGAIATTRVSGTPPDAEGSGDGTEETEAFVTALATARPDTWKTILVKLTALVQDEKRFAMAEQFLV